MNNVIMDLETDGLLDIVSKVHIVVLTDIDTGETLGFTDEPHKLTREQQAHVGGSVQDGLAMARDAGLLVTFNGWEYDLLVLEKLYPEWSHKGLHFDLRTHGNTIMPKDRLIAKDKGLVLHGKLPANMIGRESLKAWALRFGGEQKGDYSGGWDELNPDMWDYGLQDGPTTLDVYHGMMQPKYRVPWLVAWIEQETNRLTGRAQRNGWRFNEGKAAMLDAHLQKELGDARRMMEAEFGSWYRLDTVRSKQVLVQGPLGGFRVFDRTKVPTKILTSGKHTIWRVQVPAKDRVVTKGGLLPGLAKGPVKYTKGAPLTPVETHIFQASSRQDVYLGLHRKYGWEPALRTEKGGPQVSAESLEGLEWPEAVAAHKYYKLEKLSGYVAAWRKVAKNGRIYGSIHPNRANTRRMTHSNPNVAQVPSAKTELGAACRELFEADEGWVSVGADAAGLELRTLANRLAKYDGGAFAVEILQGDPHTAFAAAATGIGRDAIVKPIRDAGKSLTYAFIYGAGGAKLASTYLKLGVGKKSGAAVRRGYEEGIPGLGDLTEDLRNALQDRGYIDSLDGGRLYSRADHSVLNLQLQSDGALLMKLGLIFADELLTAAGLYEGRDWKFLMPVHDEVQGTSPAEHAHAVGKAFVDGMLQAGRFFDTAIPIDGEYKVGSTWKETH